MILENPHRGNRAWSLACAAAFVVFRVAFSGRSIAEPCLRGGARLPMSLEVNEGQADSQVKFLSRGRGYALSLTPTEAVLVLRSSAATTPDRARSHTRTDGVTVEQKAAAILKVMPIGGNSQAAVEPLDPLPGLANYFIGQDPRNWKTGVRTYGKIRYREIYPGIDLVYYGCQGDLEYDFVIQPGADPESIRLSLDRKSTRLNSSHANISYAVFCLKKKKK